MKNKTLILFFFILLFSALSCQMMMDPGGIEITIVLPESAKMVLPETENESWFRVTGRGPEGSTFELLTESYIVQQEDIAPGAWIIQIEAYNKNNELIGNGKCAVQVEDGRRVYIDVLIVPSEGWGDLLVEALWDSGENTDASVRAKLYPTSGKVETLDFDVQEDGIARSFKDSIPNGSYTLAAQLLEGEIVCGSSIHQLLVVNGLTTRCECELSGSIQDDDTGNLSLSISSGFQARTILPSIDMTITTYDLLGTRADGASFVRFGVPNPGSLLIPIAPGEWNISAYAINPDTYLIGEGSETVNVRVGKTTAVTLTVYPLNDDGTLNVQLSWPVGSIQQPSIEISLKTPEGSSVLTEQMQLSGNGVLYENDAVTAGYYKMELKLYDGSALVWINVEAVRIVAGAVTEAVHDLTF